MKRFIKRAFNAFGLDIIKLRNSLETNLNLDEHLGYDYEDEATEYIQSLKNHTMLSKKRLVTLYQQAIYCEICSIPGAFVECGVWKGGAVGLMAFANLRHGMQRRNIHLFDSFQEICEPNAAVDGHRALADVKTFTGKRGLDKGRLHPLKGIYDSMGGPGSLEENKYLLEKVVKYDATYLHYHVGWFQDTLPGASKDINDIAILRLDGDWYASTKICLEYLFEKVVPGGIVIIDDYGTYDGCKRAVDEYFLKNGIKAYLGHVDRDCRYLIKR